MKKILPILLMLAACYACKKDKSPNKQLLLSKVYEDGLLKMEFQYSADKKPQRRNNYSTYTGQSVFSGFCLYQYENGLPKEVSNFNKDNKFSNRYVVLYDQNKRPSRLDYYSSSNILTYYYTLDYNANSKLSGYTAMDAATNKKYQEAQFNYDQQGHLAGINRYEWNGNTKYKSDSSTFVFENKEFPAWWSYYEMIPIVGLPNGDKTFYDMIITSSFYRFTDAPPSITETTYFDKTYNNEGLLIKQRISYKFTYIGAPTTNTVEKTYEYTE